MSLFEGANDQSVEQLGLITVTLQEGLLQSVSPRPGEPEVLSLFPAWPKSWEASYRLLARGGFLVTSAMQKSEIEFVEIESRFGETCRLRNPWGRSCIVTETGDAAVEMAEDVLVFDTTAGKTYRVLLRDRPEPATRQVAPPRQTEPASYRFKLRNGNVVQGTFGIGNSIQ